MAIAGRAVDALIMRAAVDIVPGRKLNGIKSSATYPGRIIQAEAGKEQGTENREPLMKRAAFDESRAARCFLVFPRFFRRPVFPFSGPGESEGIMLA